MITHWLTHSPPDTHLHHIGQAELCKTGVNPLAWGDKDMTSRAESQGGHLLRGGNVMKKYSEKAPRTKIFFLLPSFDQDWPSSLV